MNQNQFIYLANLVKTKKLIFVTGKGGIGKTTVSIALGQYAASLGKKVLIAEVAATPQVAPAFHISSKPQTEVSIDGSFQSIQLTSDGNFREYVTKYLLKAKAFEQIVSNKILTSFFNALPGLAEAMLLGRLYFSCEIDDSPPDLLIFDAPASGHFKSLMTTPEAIIKSGLVGPLVRETTKVLEFLRERRKCGIVMVGTPEDLVVSEMIDFIPRIQAESPVQIDAVVFNRDVVETHWKPDSGIQSDYWNEKIAAANKAKSTFNQAANKWSFHLDESQIISLPELGWISEPLDRNFFKRFIDEVGIANSNR